MADKLPACLIYLEIKKSNFANVKKLSNDQTNVYLVKVVVLFLCCIEVITSNNKNGIIGTEY